MRMDSATLMVRKVMVSEEEEDDCTVWSLVYFPGVW